MPPFIYSTTAAFLISATAAQAQDTSGFYLRAFGGLSAVQGDDFRLGGNNNTTSFGAGTLAGATLGYDYANSPWRAEVEFAYRSSDAEDLAPGLATEGDFASTSFMLNGIYEFEARGRWQPYAGLGLGYVTEIDFDLEGGTGAGEYADRGVFAGQLILGAEYSVSQRSSVFGELRYFITGSADLVSDAGTRLDASYDTLDLVAGLKFQF